MCPTCEIFAQHLETRQPDEYRALARKLLEVVNQKGFKVEKADCPLEDVLGATFPGDSLRHNFKCNMCGRRFALHANTYHGHVVWKPGPQPASEDSNVN